jgi:hypothetical protein
MTANIIFQEIQNLPESLQQRVLDFVQFLKSRQVGKQADKADEAPKKRIFGLAKGKIHLAPDFDEPLEDFREYTPKQDGFAN